MGQWERERGRSGNRKVGGQRDDEEACRRLIGIGEEGCVAVIGIWYRNERGKDGGERGKECVRGESLEGQ